MYKPITGEDLKIMQTVIKKWGNSLGARIPAAFAEDARFTDGTPVEMILNVEDGSITIRHIKQYKKYTLDELLAKVPDDAEPHGETDWGEPVGREEW